MKTFKSFIANLLLVSLPSVCILLLVLEAVFTYLIPASEIPTLRFSMEDQMLSYVPGTKGLFTAGKLAQIKRQWTINNYGWNSSIEYSPDHAGKRLVAIIGDSYIEGLQVEPENNISRKLSSRLAGSYEVYSFGISRAPLSQYLNLLRYVNKYFQPEIVVFNIVHNDFNESLCEDSKKKGMLCIDSWGKEVIPEYNEDQLIRLSRKSALVRYLFLNCHIKKFFHAFSEHYLSMKYIYNANIDVQYVLSKYNKIVRMLDHVLTSIEKEYPEMKILFMMDAPMNDLYHNNIPNSNVLWMTELMRDKCQEHGFLFLDLTGPFQESFRVNPIRFESDYDSHWNEHGHEVAAEALFEKLMESGFVEPSP